MDKEAEDLEWQFAFNRTWKHLKIDPYAGMTKAEKDAMVLKALNDLSSHNQAYFDRMEFEKLMGKEN